MDTSRQLDWWLQAKSSSLRYAIAAFLLIAAACGFVAWLGVPHAAIYGHDTFIALDGSWRVLHGQRPHVDFYSAFGPVPYLIAAAGLMSAGLRVDGLAYATAGIGFLIGIWALALVRNRLKAWPASLYLAWIVLFWLAPYPLGEPFYMTGYAMQYNRLSYALAALMLLELFVPQLRTSSIEWGGVSTGVATALLLFTKVSFLAAACLLIAGAYLMGSKSRKHFVALLAGFAAVGVPMMAYLRWQFPAMIRDLLTAAAARRTRFLEGYDPLRSAFRNLDEIAIVFGLALAAWMCLKTGPRHIFGFASLVVAADLALAMSNTQRQGLPLTLVAMLILACHIYEAFSPAQLRPARVLVALFMAATLIPTLSSTVNSWGMVLRSNVFAKSDSGARIDAPHLASLILDDHNEPRIDPAAHNGRPYADLVNEGLAMLRRESGPQDRIACLWFANPFAYALLRTPASGGAPFYAYGVNLTADAGPDGDRVLGDADVVVYPQPTGDDLETETLLRTAGAQLDRRYRIEAETTHWVLWRRK